MEQLRIENKGLKEKELQHEESNRQLKELALEKEQIKREAQKLVEQAKKQAHDYEFLVDRRMINGFLVNYLQAEEGNERLKRQMLSSMASILCFSQEEKETLGLV